MLLDLNILFMDHKNNEIQILRKYAEAWNLLDFDIVSSYLADDVVYKSQNVFSAISGKSKVIAFVDNKIRLISGMSRDHRVFAEIGYCNPQRDKNIQLLNAGGYPVIMMKLGDKNKPLALMLLKISIDNLIERIDICSVEPSPSEAIGTGEYPGLL